MPLFTSKSLEEGVKEFVYQKIEDGFPQLSKPVREYLAEVVSEFDPSEFEKDETELMRINAETPRLEDWGDEYPKIKFHYHRNVGEIYTRLGVFTLNLRWGWVPYMKRGRAGYREAAFFANVLHRPDVEIYSEIDEQYADIIAGLAGNAHLGSSIYTNNVLETPKGKVVFFDKTLPSKGTMDTRKLETPFYRIRIKNNKTV
jgi:hypothetical protein